MGLVETALSAIASAVGAVMHWAVTYQGAGFRLSAVGVVLAIAGITGFIASSFIFGIVRTSVGMGHYSLNRQVIDSQGHASSLLVEMTQPMMALRHANLESGQMFTTRSLASGVRKGPRERSGVLSGSAGLRRLAASSPFVNAQTF